MSQSSARFADFVNLVERAIEVGRAAVPSRLHTDALVAWLGGDTSPRTTVALRVVDGVADFVPFAADAERVIVRTGADRVVDIDPDGLERVAQPGLWDDDRCRLVIPPGRLTGPRRGGSMSLRRCHAPRSCAPPTRQGRRQQRWMPRSPT